MPHALQMQLDQHKFIYSRCVPIPVIFACTLPCCHDHALVTHATLTTLTPSSPPSPHTPHFAHTPGSEDDAVRANAVRPLSFKALVGRGHAEFSSARQQDAMEYFQYLLEQVGGGLGSRGLQRLGC